MAIGFSVLLFAGLCQGSFGLGYKKYPPFSWSVFWGVYNILCTVVSFLFMLILAPGILSAFTADLKLTALSALCGGVWGLSAICFSKAIDKAGMSLVFGISMGVSTVVGSVVPLLTGSSDKINAFFIAGLLLTLLGVITVTLAGMKRDGKAKSSLSAIILSLLSGIGSGFMNVGFSLNSFISLTAEGAQYTQLGLSVGKWFPVLLGGNLAGLIYCIYETTKKKQWNTLTAKGALKRTALLFGVCIVWYLALILYGYSVYLLGDIGESAGWILFNSLALIVSTFWGLKTGEWKGKDKKLLFLGCGVLIVSWIFSVLQ